MKILISCKGVDSTRVSLALENISRYAKIEVLFYVGSDECFKSWAKLNNVKTKEYVDEEVDTILALGDVSIIEDYILRGKNVIQI